MENNTISKITTINILDGEDNKRIEVKLDIFNEELIFDGYCKMKINGTTHWQLLASSRYNVEGDTNKFNFEKITMSLYETMVRKIELHEIVKTFMHEVTEIEIKKD